MSVEVNTERFDPKEGERVRPEPLRLIEVDCAVVCQEVGGRPAVQGTSRLEVYESDLPKIFALVADPEIVATDDNGIPTEVKTDESRIQAAMAGLAQEREEFLNSKRIATKNPDLKWGEVQWQYDGPVNWIEKYYNMYGDRVTGPANGIPPLRRVKVLDKLPPPLTYEEKRAKAASDANSQTMSAGIAEAMLAVLKQAGVIPADANDSAPSKRRNRRSDSDT